MKYNGVTATNPKELANLFSAYFRSVYIQPDNIQYDSRVPIHNDINVCNVFVDSNIVFNILIDLDVNKGAGPDMIPPVFLCNCSPTLAVPLSYIYNLSLSTGVFPATWKFANITALFKNGSRNEVSNYRPISGLSCAAKVLEKIVTKVVFDSFHSGISIYQHGFFSGRSCHTNLSVFSNFLATSLDAGMQVDAIYFDFQKAFDRVNHQILLHKLELHGIGPPLLSWFKSYLENRIQVVNIAGVMSDEIHVSSGVPQGSHLGPVLFLLFINDLCEVFVHSRFLFFADDLKIYNIVKNTDDCHLLQSDINRLTRWCTANMMQLNTSKCKVISFSRKKIPTLFDYTIDESEILRVTTVNDLGVLFDSELRFVNHVDWIVSKAFRMLGFIMRQCCEFKNVEVLKTLYFSLVRSHLDYCCMIWSPIYRTHVTRIERVQIKFANFLLFKLKIDKSLLTHNHRLNILGLESLEKRRIKLILSFGHKLLINQIDCPDLLSLLNFRVPSRTTRQSDTFLINYSRTDIGKNEVIGKFMSYYNTLIPQEFDYNNCKPLTFKKKLKKLLDV